MGYATDEEIAAFLQELKNAEQRMADKIRDMLPKIRDDALHAELKAMLASHEENIETTNMALQQR